MAWPRGARGSGQVKGVEGYPETVSTFVSEESVREAPAGDVDRLAPSSPAAASPDGVHDEGVSEAGRR